MSSSLTESRISIVLSLFIGLSALFGAAPSVAAPAGDLRAYFDRKSVYEGDTVTLIIEATGGKLGQPDLSSLGADFDLLGTSQSTNISIVNGRRTDTVRLLVTLAPRRTGTIEVPSIDVGGEKTTPLTLEVSEVPEGGSVSVGDDIFVELEAGSDSRALMVQQQVPLTVRLFSALPLLSGTLDPPRVAGAVVTKLGEDREYITSRDGRRYRVVERRYTLSPERSGELRIPPVAFEGSVRASKGRGGRIGGGLFDNPFFDGFFNDDPLSTDPFSMFDRGRPVSARSRAVTLNVEARPGEYAGDHWLPAQTLEISDSWAQSPPQLRVGEPVTRNLTLRAKGLSGPQIPEIEIPAAAGLRAYPEKTRSETRSDGETVFGISRQGVTLIPSRAGELVVPEIRVTWWDTVAKKARIAKVPGWTLTVEAGSGGEVAPLPTPQPAQSPTPRQRDDPAANLGAAAGEDATITPRILAAGALVLVLLLAGVRALRRNRRQGSGERQVGQVQAANRDGPRVNGAWARKALHIACEENDAHGAAKALLDWAEAIWPGGAPRNLGSLRARLVHGGEEVRALERHLYAPQPGAWKGEDLWQALRCGMSDASPAQQAPSDLLEPLYPPRGKQLPASAGGKRRLPIIANLLQRFARGSPDEKTTR
jgi:hypothetical protein